MRAALVRRGHYLALALQTIAPATTTAAAPPPRLALAWRLTSLAGVNVTDLFAKLLVRGRSAG